jgi:uncharacterized membrane-anchored protein YjiN (DUF445 family)
MENKRASRTDLIVAVVTAIAASRAVSSRMQAQPFWLDLLVSTAVAAVAGAVAVWIFRRLKGQ